MHQMQILLLVDASFGFEMETFEFLNILQVCLSACLSALVNGCAPQLHRAQHDAMCPSASHSEVLCALHTSSLRACVRASLISVVFAPLHVYSSARHTVSQR